MPPNEDSIRVICRFRPLNTTEEKTGSKFVVKFPSGTDDQCVSIGVSLRLVKKREYSREEVVKRQNFLCTIGGISCLKRLRGKTSILRYYIYYFIYMCDHLRPNKGGVGGSSQQYPQKTGLIFSVKNLQKKQAKYLFVFNFITASNSNLSLAWYFFILSIFLVSLTP